MMKRFQVALTAAQEALRRPGIDIHPSKGHAITLFIAGDFAIAHQVLHLLGSQMQVLGNLFNI